MALGLVLVSAGCSDEPDRVLLTEYADGATQPTTRPMPDVVGVPVIQAFGQLCEESLVPQLDERVVPDEGPARNRSVDAPPIVVATDPAPAADVEPGATVIVTANRRFVVDAVLPNQLNCQWHLGRRADER